MRFTAGSQPLNKLTSHWGRNAIKAVSARFDKETNRTLARTTTATHEFDAADTEILATLLLWNLKVWNFAVAASCFSNGEGLSIAVI